MAGPLLTLQARVSYGVHMHTEASARMVFVDSLPENLIPALALRADRVLDDRWNGWLRPWATAEAAATMSAAWKVNDPNGVWGDVAEVNGSLVWSRDDGDDPDTFPLVGVTEHGRALYDLTGWCWVYATDRGPTNEALDGGASPEGPGLA